jgi:hypothetical protein
MVSFSLEGRVMQMTDNVGDCMDVGCSYFARDRRSVVGPVDSLLSIV